LRSHESTISDEKYESTTHVARFFFASGANVPLLIGLDVVDAGEAELSINLTPENAIRLADALCAAAGQERPSREAELTAHNARLRAQINTFLFRLQSLSEYAAEMASCG
jgi:hypothetical protein